MKKVLLIFIYYMLSISVLYSQQNYKPDNDNLNESSELTFAEAVMLSTKGDYDNAIIRYKELLTNQVKDKYIYYSLLETYSLKAGKVQMSAEEDALKALYSEEMYYSKEALGLYTNDLKLLYFYADSVRNLGLADEYISVLEKILSLNDFDVFANYYIGDYYFINKEYQQAASYFQRVLTATEEGKEFDLMARYRSLYSLGIISIMGGDFQDAVLYLEKAREIYSNDLELIKTLAMTYAGNLDFVKAKENFDILPDAAKNDEVSDMYYGVLFTTDQNSLKKLLTKKTVKSHYLLAADFYLKKKYKDSIKELDLSVSGKKFLDYYLLYLYYLDYKASGNKDKVYQYSFMLGNKAKEVGKTDLAISYYKILLTNTNSIPSIYWLIGSLYDDKNDYRDAIYYYNKYLNSKGGDEYKIQALIRISDMYYRQKNISEAARQLAKARTLAVKKSDQFQVYFYSGLIEFENKRYTNAVNEFKEAAKADVKESRLYYFLGASYFELGEYDNVIQTLETGIKYDSRSPEMNNLLAYAYSIEKIKLDEAISLVNQSLLMQPENLAYMDTLGWIFFQKEDFKKSFEIFNHIINVLDRESKIEGEDDLDEIYYHIGMIYEKMGKKEEAMGYYSIGLKINPLNNLIKQRMK